MTRIGLDLDGVVFDHAGPFVELYNNWFDSDLDAIEYWDDVLTLTHFPSHAEAWQWASRAGLWQRLPYIAGAPAAIDFLDHHHQVVFVTARNGEAVKPTQEWHRNSPWSHIELRVAQTNKLSTPCGVYVDDSPQVIEAVRAAGKVAIVFDQPWNQDVETDDKSVFRAEDWSDVIEIVEGL